jgi:DNA adenine methylase
MKYMGSKNRIARHILPIILQNRTPDQWYVEPFFGGGNSMQYVDGNRLGGEANFFIASMWNKLINGWTPDTITKEQYQYIKSTDDPISEHIIGWVATACSYSGKWFGGFAGKVNTKGGLRDYQAEAFANVKKQLPKLKGVYVDGCSYGELCIPPESIIYCDPPYAGTTQYKDVFNSDEHWQWCREKVEQGHQVFVSEYIAPEDFICVWSQEVKSSLSANGKSGESKSSIEKLFVHKSQVESGYHSLY